MADDDRALAIAARIADGSAIDWPDADVTPGDPGDAAIIEELKAIAALATLARTPIEWSESAAADPSARWGPLTLIAPIGEGAFGRVYRAWDGRLHRQVALKILHSAAAPGISAARAIDEARRLARVRHPNVLTIHGADTFEGQTGIWTEFIEGRTLDAIVAANGPLPADEVVRIGVDLCHALAAVHDAGLLHRDVKASNVMRETGGRIVLMDFGTGLDRDRALTNAGDLSGTPLYLAPEIYSGHSATISSDIYAAGVLLYFLLTGRHPVAGKTLEDVRHGHQQHASLDLRSVRPDVPPALADAIARAIATDPSARFNHASVFAEALANSQRAVLAPSSGRWMKRTRWIALAAATVIAVAGARPVWRMIRNTGDATAVGVPPDNWQVRLPQPRMGRIARNGRYIPYVDSQGRLQLFDAVKGGSTPVVTTAPGTSLTASLASPSGDRIVYVVGTPDGGRALRVISADGSRVRDLIPGTNTAFTPVPLDWSRDGKEILCRLDQRDGTFDLALIAVADGKVQPPLVTGLRESPHNASLAPDGRFVAYDSNAKGVRLRALYVVGRDGSPHTLMDGPTNDLFPMWMPDGTGVLFARENALGVVDAWLLPVVNGAAQGEARLIAENLGPVEALSITGAFTIALTADGAFYRSSYKNWQESYITDTDSRGAPTGAPQRIAAKSIGEHVSPSWSSDGRSLAYLTTRDEPTGKVSLKTLTIQDHWPGVERFLNPDLYWVGGYAPAWSPDGQSVIIWGRESEDRWGLYSVDLKTSAVSLVVRLPGNTMQFFERHGGSLYYLDEDRGIVRHDVRTNFETVIVPDKSGLLHKFRVAADGERIVFVRDIVSATKLVSKQLIVQAQGTEHVVHTAAGSDWLGVQSWSADGQWILFTQSSNTAGDSTRDTLFRVSAKGGDPEDLGFAIAGNRTSPMMLQPSGNRLAYIERDKWLQLQVVERLPKGR